MLVGFGGSFCTCALSARWVLVLFLNGVEMRYGEHGRRLRARAQALFAAAQEEAALEEGVADVLEAELNEMKGELGELGEQQADDWEEDDDDDSEDGEDDEELQCLLHALQVTDESDHELFYDLGARAHDMGDTEEALRMYMRADALNGRDPLLLSNMGVAHLELGSPRAALRCYRRALAVDPYNVNARFNCGELLLESGRMRGLQALLADAPEDVLQQPEIQELAAELEQ